MEDNKMLTNAIESIESLQFIKAATFLGCAFSDQLDDQQYLYKELSQFLINYHSTLSRFHLSSYWPETQLYANTTEFRNLSYFLQTQIRSENARINSLFQSHSSTFEGRIIISMFNANYWLRLVDGFRVSLWLYRSILHSKERITLPEKFSKLPTLLKEMVLSSLEIAPYEKISTSEAFPSVYLEFDDITSFLEGELKISFNDTNKLFLPNFQRLLFVNPIQ